MKTSRQRDLLVFHGITEEGDYAASAYSSSLSILHLVVFVNTVSTHSAVGHHHKSI
jgi:hypothetical protein